MIDLEKLETKINTNKEVLEALPKNNKKNISNYIDEITKEKVEFTVLQRRMEQEIEKRYDKISNVKENPEIKAITKKIEGNEAVLYLLNDVDTSYEKMDLDELLFNLKYYYRKNLETVNEAILGCIKKFETIGISLNPNDFDYSEYAHEYITELFREMENQSIGTDKNNKFDEIYWKCPEIIHHVFLNIKYIYDKNKKQIDRYYEKQKENLLKNFTASEQIERYVELKTQLDELINKDKAIVIKKFLNGELSTKDFSEISIKEAYTKFISSEMIDFEDEEKMNEIDSNLEKLLNSLYEYKQYLTFKFIIDDVKKIYAEKDKYKNSYAQMQKEIDKKERERIKLNQNINKKSLFNKSKEKYKVKRDALVLDIQKEYSELYESKVYDKIVTEIDEKSTLKDILDLASSFYKYAFKCICNHDKEITEEDALDIIESLKEFLKYPYFTIMNNVKISEDKDIMLIIKDRYKLQNINIEREDLEFDNLDSMIETIQKIMIAHNIRINKIDLEEVACACEFKKILNK